MLILVGVGILYVKVLKELISFVCKYEIFVVYILFGFGGFLLDDELFLGMGGMYGFYIVNMVLYECDLFINIGVRFDDCFIGNLVFFVKGVIVVYIDIDLVEIGKNVLIEIFIVVSVK